MGSEIDPAQTARALERCLALHARDALAAAVAAGALPGAEGIALRMPLREIARDEIDEVERLAARIVSLGGKPDVAAEPVALPKTFAPAVRALLEMQRETLAALVDAIPADADDPEGEATEHLLEHVIDRKRNGIELLERAVR